MAFHPPRGATTAPFPLAAPPFRFAASYTYLGQPLGPVQVIRGDTPLHQRRTYAAIANVRAHLRCVSAAAQKRGG